MIKLKLNSLEKVVKVTHYIYIRIIYMLGIFIHTLE